MPVELRTRTMIFRTVLPVLVLAWPSLLKGQELKYIDLDGIRQRTELRHPPAPQTDCKQGAGCLGGGYGGGSIGDGAPDQRDPHALGIYLLRVTPTDIRAGEMVQVEFKILNTGTVPIELPVSPHLADLQPSDETVSFQYWSLALVVRVETDPRQPEIDTVGFVQLFGARERVDSLVMLRPGGWIRVKANVKLLKCPPTEVSARLRGEFWLRKNTFHPHPGGQFTEANNLYPNSTPTPFVAVRLIPGSVSERPKQ